jgi:hypothetical protein
MSSPVGAKHDEETSCSKSSSKLIDAHLDAQADPASPRQEVRGSLGHVGHTAESVSDALGPLQEAAAQGQRASIGFEASTQAQALEHKSPKSSSEVVSPTRPLSPTVAVSANSPKSPAHEATASQPDAHPTSSQQDRAPTSADDPTSLSVNVRANNKTPDPIPRGAARSWACRGSSGIPSLRRGAQLTCRCSFLCRQARSVTSRRVTMSQR